MTRERPLQRLVFLVLVASFLRIPVLGAQGSPYVPLDDVAYSYVESLMARGMFRELSVLERPLTERALRVAIDSARARGPNAVVSSYLDALSRAIAKYSARPGDTSSSTFRARGTGNLYLTSQTSGRRELMLSDHERAVQPGGTLRLIMAGGPVAGVFRVLIDGRLNKDPEFSGRKDRTLTARTEDGYLRAEWRYGELSLGRVARNWGPPTLSGLQLGNYAYSYDHLYGRIGTEKVRLSTVIARLDDFQLPDGSLDQRYFSIHRLSFRRGGWEIAGSESYVYTGRGRGFEPALVNPFNIFALSWRNENEGGNLGFGAEIAHRSNFGTVAGHFFLDDLQIDECDPDCSEPTSFGLTLSAEGLPLAGEQRWFVSYTRVSNLLYRTPAPAETYSMLGVGLGRGFSDYDELRAGADLALIPRTPLRLYAARRRQGEGDYRVAYPPAAAYPTTPGIFSGVVMVVTRLGVSGASRWGLFEVAGDLGLNRARNYRHVPGSANSSFAGRLRIAVEPRWSISF